MQLGKGDRGYADLLGQAIELLAQLGRTVLDYSDGS